MVDDEDEGALSDSEGHTGLAPDDLASKYESLCINPGGKTYSEGNRAGIRLASFLVWTEAKRDSREALHLHSHTHLLALNKIPPTDKSWRYFADVYFSFF